MDTYVTVKNYSCIEFVEKRSRFIGYCTAVQNEADALTFIEKIRKKHWDATHNVYAYSLRNGTKRFSDDNEPQGTAGVPTLDVLEKNSVTDAVIVVTRYFGGVLLGAGGLVRAYSHTASLALKSAEIVTMELCVISSIACDYAQYSKISAAIFACDGVVDNTEFTDNVELTFHIPEQNIDTLCKQFSEILCRVCAIKKLDKQFFEQKSENNQ